ncbi:hybrid sensor histidine kinase/response regulator [Rheinheimera sp.]|uniref:hybrid sensor histidine kinase/response regulator n=1 Tax=Rheinheimera sp. TaxID=1869214 RepID=UPI003AF74E57
MNDQFQNASLLELFLLEAQAQTQLLDQGLIRLSTHPASPAELESCMRAAHSIKGAARLVGVNPAADLAHEMEELLVLAMRGQVLLSPQQTQLLMQGSAAILQLAQGQTVSQLASLIQQLKNCLNPSSSETAAPATPVVTEPVDAEPDIMVTEQKSGPHEEQKRSGTVRVSSERLDLLLDLASRALVLSKNSQQFTQQLIRLKKKQQQAKKMLEAVRDKLVEQQLPDYFNTALADLGQLLTDTSDQVHNSLQHYDETSWQTLLLNQNLYDAALACRMRPFSDLFQGKARMVYELSSSMGKQVQLQVSGETTSVDRDMLDKLEAPLLHLLRNAVDHGIEQPQQRKDKGKPELATISLNAWHSAGFLYMEISDDGKGVDTEQIKQRVLSRGLSTAEAVAQMNEEELLAFLFLPDFSLAKQVSAVSGRGVGLDAVQHDVKTLGGDIELHNNPGLGCKFLLRLPVTVSVIRSVIVQLQQELYAVPLPRIETMLHLTPDDISTLEGRPHLWWQGDAVALLPLSQLLGFGSVTTASEALAVLILQDKGRKIGLVVDKLLGEQNLVVLHMDPRLGRISGVMAGAVLSDGSPTLILDVDDVLVSAHTELKQGQSLSFSQKAAEQSSKKILVVDDSLTVRELERKLLSNQGYQVKVAVDGLEGWTMLRAEAFDLVVTDIDMPKMDGIELVRLVRSDARLNRLPVIVVSYKDRDEDKNRGLEAGADYYLAKSSFHDESLLEAVRLLIGDAAG